MTGSPELRGHSAVVTALIFGFSVTALMMIVLALSYQDSYARGSTVSGIVSPEVVGEHAIIVTATVEEALGSRLLKNDLGRVIYLVYGNFKKGFSVISNEENESVYDFVGMPGDGVQVDLDSSDNYKIVPKY